MILCKEEFLPNTVVLFIYLFLFLGGGEGGHSEPLPHAFKGLPAVAMVTNSKLLGFLGGGGHSEPLSHAFKGLPGVTMVTKLKIQNGNHLEFSTVILDF